MTRPRRPLLAAALVVMLALATFAVHACSATPTEKPIVYDFY